jgi:hypothetical protein
MSSSSLMFSLFVNGAPSNAEAPPAPKHAGTDGSTDASTLSLERERPFEVAAEVPPPGQEVLRE